MLVMDDQHELVGQKRPHRQLWRRDDRLDQPGERVERVRQLGIFGPQPATLRLEDEQDRPGERAGRPSLGWEVRIGESGEIQVRGAAPLPGYWNDPQATSESLTGDGFCRTGDVGVIDADGYLTVIDRLKDMIITGGENVYPAEVEAVLARHPDVAEVAVIGLPDDRWGETVHAAELPRNATGKVLKSVLREPHWSGRDRQVS